MQINSKRRLVLGGSLGLVAAAGAVLFAFGVPQTAGGCGGPSDAADESSDNLVNFEPEDPLPGVGELRSAFSFTVKSGHHHSNHDLVSRPHLGHNVDRSLSFTATFSADAAYTTANPSNQSDWNKIMGISTDRIHKNSIRIGWAWNPATQLIDLGYYGYMDSNRVMPRLTSVALGTPISCSVHMSNSSMTATCGGVSHTENGSMNVSLPLTWILHSVYFGGNETAPHDIHVNVTDIQAN